MRNGNSILPRTSLSPTLFLSYLWGMETTFYTWIRGSFQIRVLILPMRNGNIQNTKYKKPDSAFLSYLWGMETQFFCLSRSFCHRCSYPTYEEWKLEPIGVTEDLPSAFLSYLWGMETDSSILIQQSLKNVLILPMRNGNSTSFSFSSRYFICSYPTYEEWKLFLNIIFYNGNFIRSYPTYEEWKLGYST